MFEIIAFTISSLHPLVTPLNLSISDAGGALPERQREYQVERERRDEVKLRILKI